MVLLAAGCKSLVTLGSASCGWAHAEGVRRIFGSAFSPLCLAERALNLAALAHADVI